MVSSVKSRRNHYEILGLRPGATDDDIAAAFATESRKIIQNPRVNEPDVREKARQIRTAHQTLRDPVKRAAYDSSMGFGANAPKEPEASAEPSAQPFVAASRDGPKGDPVPPGDQHVAEAPNDAAKARGAPRARAPRRRPERQPNPTTGLPEGLTVAAMAATSDGKTAQQSPEIVVPESQAEPPEPASEPDAPFVAAPSDDGGKAQASEADAAADAAVPPVAEPESQQEIPAPTEPEHATERLRFDDTSAGTAGFYGERRGRKLNRTAAGTVAALGVALAVAAVWLWPSENRGGPISDTRTGTPMASADGTQVPADVLNGLASEEAGSDLEDPFGATDMADAGSYQSLTFSDSGPVPGSSALPSGTASPPPSGQAVASPSAASDPGTATAAAPAPAPAAPSGAGAQASPVAGAPVVANVPARSQPAPDLRPITPPKLVRGSILNSDNRRGAFQGTVSVRFTVGANGRATGCSPTASSGNPRLDAYTCELVQQRLQFEPAVTAQGRPVASEMRATYTWGRKRRTLTGRLLDIIR